MLDVFSERPRMIAARVMKLPKDQWLEEINKIPDENIQGLVKTHIRNAWNLNKYKRVRGE